MFSYELFDYITKRNSLLTTDEYFEATDLDKNSQIDHIKYDPFENMTNIWTKDGYSFKVKIINI